MIFYQLADGTLVGTQADAKASKQPWEQVDVPTDKAGLMDHINRLRGEFEAGDVPQAPPTPAPAPSEWDRCPKCNNTRRLAEFYAGLEGAKAIREAILTCDAQFVNGHVDAVIDRLKAMKETSDG